MAVSPAGTSLLPFRDLFERIFALEARALLVEHIQKLNSDSQDQEYVSHYIKKNMHLHISVFMCISWA